jgi:hypothetical protein
MDADTIRCLLCASDAIDKLLDREIGLDVVAQENPVSVQKVEVFWWDAQCEHLLLNGEGCHTLSPVLRSNLGYLVVKDDSKLVLSFGVARHSDGDLYDCNFVIPTSMVKEIRYVDSA